MATPSAQYAYYPVVTAQPVFANVVVAESVMDVPPDVVAVINAAQSVSVRQHVKLFPKSCCSCPPCVKQENTYSVYAGLSRDSEAEFLRLDEVSDDWNRCCCTPYHPLKLEARAVLPAPGTNSDWDNLNRDLVGSWATLTAAGRASALRDAYKRYPVLFTMQRDDGMRCCCKCPCKWLSTFVCFSCCQDGMKVYAGATPDPTDGGEKGRPVPDIGLDRLLGSVEQPNFGGCCFPTLHLRSEREDVTTTPYGKIEGPFCFGGWSEMCFSFKFSASKFDSPAKTGDIAVIKKKKPESLGGAVTELFSNADNYTIEFDDQAKLSFSQKVTVITAQVLADYMFFDGNTEKCKNDDSGITCYFWYCSVIGHIIPCCLYIPKNS